MEAIDRGANCIIVGKDVQIDKSGVTVIKVEDTIEVLA